MSLLTIINNLITVANNANVKHINGLNDQMATATQKKTHLKTKIRRLRTENQRLNRENVRMRKLIEAHRPCRLEWDGDEETESNLASSPNSPSNENELEGSDVDVGSENEATETVNIELLISNIKYCKLVILL